MWANRRGIESGLFQRKKPDYDYSSGIAMRVDAEKLCALPRIDRRLTGRLLYSYRESIPDRKPHHPYKVHGGDLYHNQPYDIYTLAALDRKRTYGRDIAEADQEDAMELHWVDHAACLRDSI